MKIGQYLVNVKRTTKLCQIIWATMYIERVENAGPTYSIS